MTDNHRPEDGRTKDGRLADDPLTAATDALRSREAADGPSDELIRRTVLRMSEAASRSDIVSSQQERSRPQRIRRYVMRGLSTAACLMIAATIYFAASGTATAFAAVHQQIREAKTLAYTSFVHTVAGNAVVETRVQVNKDGRERQETLLGPTKIVMIVDPAQGRTLSLDATTKTATTLTYDGQQASRSSAEWINAFRRGPTDGEEKLDSRTIGGAEAEGYRMTQGGFTFDVWIDPQTEELVEIEYRVEALANLVTKIVMRDFVFNEPMDAALFSMDVPEGYREMSAEIPKVETDGFVSVRKALTSYSELADGEFPDSLTDWGNVFTRLLNTKEGGIPGEEEIKKATTVGVYFGGALPYLTQLGKTNYAYLGKGRTANDGKGIVFWARDDTGDIKAIFDDLSVREVGEEDMPE